MYDSILDTSTLTMDCLLLSSKTWKRYVSIEGSAVKSVEYRTARFRVRDEDGIEDDFDVLFSWDDESVYFRADCFDDPSENYEVAFFQADGVVVMADEDDDMVLNFWLD